MVYSPKTDDNSINLPHSAYRWILLDSVECNTDELFAVYEHNKLEIWCAITKSKITNSIDVYIFSESEIPNYVETDTECLINLITSSITEGNTFIIKSPKEGTVSDAYNLINEF